MTGTWFDELDTDPVGHPVAMGVHALGERPWLVTDSRRATEIELKVELLRTRRNDVLVTTGPSEVAARELASLCGAGADPAAHPLEASALTVQEDLCLLQRRDDGWYLDSGCVCFPTRWRLRDKIGRHITEVHGPVDGYHERIASRVDRLFDQLTDRPVWRRNWFLMADPTLFQLEAPADERLVPADRVERELFIRSERQTLRRLDSGWIVFTIRVQQEPLGALLTTPKRVARFANWVEHVPADLGRRRHLTDRQRRELLLALAR